MKPYMARKLRAIAIRKDRFQELWRGFQREFSLERSGNLSLTTKERQDYLDALRASSAAVDAARKVLALAASQLAEECAKMEAESKRAAAENRADTRFNPPPKPN
jgi:hypothetical protein